MSIINHLNAVEVYKSLVRKAYADSSYDSFYAAAVAAGDLMALGFTGRDIDALEREALSSDLV